MKSEFKFADKKTAAEFERISETDLKVMTNRFLADYGVTKVFLGNRVGLATNTIRDWLSDKMVLGERSLKRIFNYLRSVDLGWSEIFKD